MVEERIAIYKTNEKVIEVSYGEFVNTITFLSAIEKIKKILYVEHAINLNDGIYTAELIIRKLLER